MTDPAEEMTPEEIAADRIHLRAALAAEQQGRAEERTAYAAEKSALKSAHHRALRAVEEQAQERERQLAQERDAERGEREAIQKKYAALSKKLVASVRDNAVLRRALSRAEDLNVGVIGSAVLVGIVRWAGKSS